MATLSKSVDGIKFLNITLLIVTVWSQTRALSQRAIFEGLEQPAYWAKWGKLCTTVADVLELLLKAAEKVPSVSYIIYRLNPAIFK